MTLKIKENFVLKEIAGEYVIIPLGEEAARHRGLMTLNETGAFIWEHLMKGEDRQMIAEAMAAEYGIETKEAAEDLGVYLAHLEKLGVMEE